MRPIELDAIPPERDCGSCRVCCNVLPIYERGSRPTPYEFRKAPRVDCAHLCAKGCSLQNDERRPMSCRTFVCFWKLGRLPDKYRPQESHVLVCIQHREIHNGSKEMNLPLFAVYEARPGAMERASKRGLLEELVRIGLASGIAGIVLCLYEDPQPSRIWMIGGETWHGLEIPADAPPVWESGDAERDFLERVWQGEPIPTGHISIIDIATRARKIGLSYDQFVDAAKNVGLARTT